MFADVVRVPTVQDEAAYVKLKSALQIEMRHNLEKKRTISGPNVLCNGVIFPAHQLYLARGAGKRLDLTPFCYLATELTFLRPFGHQARRGPNNAALIVDDSENLIGLQCPGGQAIYIHEGIARIDQVKQEFGEGLEIFFVQACEDDHGVPSWISGELPASHRYSRSELDITPPTVQKVPQVCMNVGFGAFSGLFFMLAILLAHSKLL
jgi:hypothetical protein